MHDVLMSWQMFEDLNFPNEHFIRSSLKFAKRKGFVSFKDLFVSGLKS